MSSSVAGATFNLIVSIVGTGILSFPWAFSGSGLLWAFLMLSGCTFFAYISMKLLIIASDALKKQFPDQNIAPSFQTLAMISGGRRLTLFTQIVVIISLWGSANSRILGAGQIIRGLYIEYSGMTDPDQSTLKLIKAVAITTFTVAIIFPLGLMRSMSSLRFTSLLSVICSVFLSLSLLSEYLYCGSSDTTCFWNFNHEQISEYITAPLTLQSIGKTLPIFIFGYNCHPSVFPIYKSLNEESGSSGMSMVFKGALTVSFILYTIAGSSGFLLFPEETPSNILDYDYPGKPVHIEIAKFLFAAAMILAVPTFVNAIRGALIEMVIIYRTEMEEDDVETTEKDTNGVSRKNSNGVFNAIPTGKSNGSSSSSELCVPIAVLSPSMKRQNSEEDITSPLRLESNSLSGMRFNIKNMQMQSLNVMRSPNPTNSKMMNARLRACKSLGTSVTPQPLVPFPSISMSGNLSRGLSFNRTGSRSQYRKAGGKSGNAFPEREGAVDALEVTVIGEGAVKKTGSVKQQKKPEMTNLGSVKYSIRLGSILESESEDELMETYSPLANGNSGENGKDSNEPIQRLSTLKHVIISCVICIVLAVPAMFVDDIDVVFGLLGCTTNPISGYILPTCFVLLLVPSNEQKRMKVIAVMMSVVIAVLSVFNLYNKIVELSTY